ncbi:protein-L-isoaspartate O-methyltransferase [Microtetraspora sp. NBRC 13810]|uniref:methyltransferase domain-containing protein n=1 Tax=Microtetraspora sp. NBRC 13810 TaxID=3030990 RepID=UPI00249FB54D|nr:methyltransferase domain-containing protein [Microtetraspora sp. NBRC 13810]GLW06234.1 protein-L-isoaspartate O-methyltransferase [Microtetraspora sp. NBRC 13810]
MTWQEHAQTLAHEVTHRGCWYGAVANIPRHLLVPHWWDDSKGHWVFRDGPSDPESWMAAAYSDQTLATQVGPLHADHAQPDDDPPGRPTSSSTLPGLVVAMLRHLHVPPGAAVLDVATGSGYSAALLCHQLGDEHVTSIDVDPYLTEVAAERLDAIDLHPKVLTCDATGALPGEYDRIVAMVSVQSIPPGWLTALRPGGRLVAVIANTSLIITANKTDDGGAVGRVEWDRAAFMETRTGPDYPPGLQGRFEAIQDGEDEEVTEGRYPVVNVSDAWDLASMLEVTAPGIEHFYRANDGSRTAWMIHEDGSWAVASAVGDELPVVRQGGSRRLWDIPDDIRHRWLVEGELPLRGARVWIEPDGVIRLARAGWRATIP